jgi:hypothetical protein
MKPKLEKLERKLSYARLDIALQNFYALHNSGFTVDPYMPDRNFTAYNDELFALLAHLSHKQPN